MMTEALVYRLFEERDLPSLLRLWEEAGWGTLTAEEWRRWYVETPNGSALVTVGVNGEGEVVAQEMFMPTVMDVDGREVRALRFSAPILRTEIRGESLRRDEHPLVGLFKAAASEAARRGFGVIYSLPEYGWLPIFRLAPRFGAPCFTEAGYACVSLPFRAAASGSNGNGRGKDGRVGEGDVYSGVTDGDALARPVKEFGEEYDELWRSARETFPINCGVVRRRDWLGFRNGGRISVEVRERSDGSLIGYAATKRQNGLLADVLARRPDDLARVLSATLKWLGSARGSERVPETLTHLKVMRTPALDAALEELGGEALDYRFAFTCCALDASLAPEAIAPERWYVMPGD